MDPLTHGLLGACCSQSVLKKRLPNAWLVGGLAALTPDLDIVIQSVHNPMTGIIYHRQFSHSLVFIPVAGLLLTGLFCALFKSIRPHAGLVFIAAILAYLSHDLLDACTHYGTQLLWPFSDRRIAWDIISIVDPVFTLLLLLSLIFFLKNKTRMAYSALACAACYLMLATWQHHRAFNWQTAHLPAGTVAQRVVPTLANIVVWNTLARTDQHIVLQQVKTLLTGSPEPTTRSFVVPLFSSEQLPDDVRQSSHLSRIYRQFSWFSDGFVTDVQKQPLVVADVLFIRTFDPLTVLWGIRFDNDHPRWVYNVNIEPSHDN